MKHIKIPLFVLALVLGLTGKVYAKENVNTTLFPRTVGMIGEVQAENLNIRSYPDISAQIIGQMKDKELKIIGKHQEWYKVLYEEQEAWVYAQYVKVEHPDLVPYARVKGEEVIAYGMQFIGTPYVWGGTELKNGVDCSGFTQQVFKAFDVSISRVSYMQAEDGMSVKKSQLEPGDLIFFDTTGVNNGQISHVGIYMGEDKFIHSESSRGVTISNLNSPYYTRNYVKAIRVL